nr:ATP-binding protein [Zoogloeaceae bacterium]
PARFQLIAAMNPCPCGYFGAPDSRCHCSAEQIRRYRGRISGPLLDRMDVVIEVPLLDPAELQGRLPGETSAVVRERVERAWARQRARQGVPNSQMAPALVDGNCAPDAKGQALLGQAIERLRLSARAYHRILKLARTIADLGGADTVGVAHVAEAIQYRRSLAPS